MLHRCAASLLRGGAGARAAASASQRARARALAAGGGAQQRRVEGVSVDRSGLRGALLTPPRPGPPRETWPSNPTAAALWRLRAQRGHPLPLSEFMETCLTNEVRSA